MPYLYALSASTMLFPEAVTDATSIFPPMTVGGKKFLCLINKNGEPAIWCGGKLISKPTKLAHHLKIKKAKSDELESIAQIANFLSNGKEFSVLANSAERSSQELMFKAQKADCIYTARVTEKFEICYKSSV